MTEDLLEDTEDVEPSFNSLLGELVNGVVPSKISLFLDVDCRISVSHSRVGSVSDSIGTSDKRLERNVRDELSKCPLNHPVSYCPGDLDKARTEKYQEGG